MSRPDIPVTITGHTKSIDAAMKRVRAEGALTGRSLTASFTAMTARIRGGASALGGLLAGGPGGLAASLGIGAFVSITQEAVSSVNELGKAARTAGLDFEAFQELKFAAQQNKVGVDALTDGLKELQLRADEFVQTGGGPAAESFARIGLSAKDVAGALKDPAEMFQLVIERLKDLDKAAQIRVMDELFGGTAAEQFAGFIKNGAQAISDARNEARQLGLVMSEDLLKAAEDIDRQFNVVTTTVGVHLKGAIVSAASSLMNFIDGFRDFQDQMDGSLKGRQAELGMKRLDIETKILETQQNQREEVGKLSDVAKSLGFEDSKNTGLAGSTGEIAAYREQLRLLAEEEAKIVGVLNERGKAKDRPKDTPWEPIITADKGGGKSKAASAAEKEAKAYQSIVDALREEIAVIGLSEVEKEKLLTLREAGVTAASKEGQQISVLIEQKHRELDAEEALTKQRERAQEIAQNLGDTLDDQMSRIIDGTFDARDAVAALVTELISASTNGKGLFGSLFSALAGGFSSGASPKFASNTSPNLLSFGGARAGGGDVSPGRIYRVNEYEEEFFSPGSHGRIIAPSKAAGNSPSGGVSERSVVEIVLSPELKAAILQEAQGQSIEIVRRNNQAQQTYKQNGGN
ncbi:phage tail tape measure protein [Rhizobium sp. 32-5/1]|uniref:phage tail tape measure protein n=1 Tax=Rhizobium sp. 32-5/1 TaxID=3019602 RepID=UPI00240E8ED7|nr:phage tail tape measure protein [Rhizobium sp. 32-5/1]WEZ84576.1 phage tail tape measure protein [Rhizobium sp. 32-5/1]